MTCPICYHPDSPPFFELPGAPVFCNVLHPTPELARSAPRAPIRLAYCEGCDFIHNAAFDESLVRYAPQYENSLHSSARFRDYADALAARLVQTYNLRSRHIVEIGAGRGEFLATLCRLGGNRGTGFDPSYKPAPGQAPPPGVTMVSEPYCPDPGRPAPDFICCRHVLEHIADPLAFLVQLRLSLDSHDTTTLYFEVPSAACTFERLAVWDVIYEHPSYFTLHSLEGLFIRAGFQPLRLDVAYDDQFLSIEAVPAQSRPLGLLPPRDTQRAQTAIRQFAVHTSRRRHSAREAPTPRSGAASAKQACDDGGMGRGLEGRVLPQCAGTVPAAGARRGRSQPA